FFQAEDGIRDFHVTGVQTCALPISRLASALPGYGIAMERGGIRQNGRLPRMIRMAMDVEAVMRAALVEAGYGPDAVGSALPRIMRILQAEDVRLEVGRPLSRKEREYVRLQLEIGLSVPEIVAALKR